MLRDPSEDASPSSFQQGILHRKDRLEAIRVPLTATAARELPVDPSGVVALGEDPVQPAELGHTGSQFDIRTPSGHVRRYGDGPMPTGLGDDPRLLTVIFRVENPMTKSGIVEQPLNSSEAATERVPRRTGRPRCKSSSTRSAESRRFSDGGGYYVLEKARLRGFSVGTRATARP